MHASLTTYTLVKLIASIYSFSGNTKRLAAVLLGTVYLNRSVHSRYQQQLFDITDEICFP